ncbi:hypothetical protein MX075_05435 [Streptococcus uberis]|nr:hypothetical protein [Streptococcus uberis]
MKNQILPVLVTGIKKSSDSKVWWIDEINVRGRHLFSFDKQKIYNVFEDYPHNLTKIEKNIFDNEERYWADFFN